eukprot:TRINITY_DN16118_c0_g1_i2.p1 TRINITY_DN16118_c0_g1~~TRINITY_DN16118_c0_g1_i2.p1  ORF type:complete len:632 (+),score=36.73 TRINITY_DN16118_c0_g1_i2:230-1897(+)
MPGERYSYVFNGDYVDRGNNGCEVLCLVMALKVLTPNHVHVNRGNHEDESLNILYGFYDECTSKYGHYLFLLCATLFTYLPLCCIVNKKVFVVHGGLTAVNLVSISELRLIPRGPNPRHTKRQHDIVMHSLWSDPSPDPGATPSPRGEGILWGPDITESFLNSNHLEKVVRSHQYPGPEGHLCTHNGRVLTVFSASNYNSLEWKGLLPDSTGETNKGSVMVFTPGSSTPEVHTWGSMLLASDDPRRSFVNPHTKQPFQYHVPYGVLSNGTVDPVGRSVSHVRHSCLRYASALTFYWEGLESEPGIITLAEWISGISGVCNYRQLSVISPSIEPALKNRGFVTAGQKVRYKAFLQQAAFLTLPKPVPKWHKWVIELAAHRGGAKGIVTESDIAGLLSRYMRELPIEVQLMVSTAVRGGAGYRLEGTAVLPMLKWTRDTSEDDSPPTHLLYLLKIGSYALGDTPGKKIDFLHGCNDLHGCTVTPAQLHTLISATLVRYVYYAAPKDDALKAHPRLPWQNPPLGVESPSIWIITDGVVQKKITGEEGIDAFLRSEAKL